MSRLINIHDFIKFTKPIGLAKPELDIQVIDQLMFSGDEQTVDLLQASETDIAQSIGKKKNRFVDRSTETDVSQSIGARKNISIAQITEADEAFSISSSKQLAISQVSETESSQAIGKIKSKSLTTYSSYEIYSDPVGGAVVYHFFLEKKTAEPYHLVDDMDYLSPDVRNWKVGQSASPSFFVTLPDDGSEYASGIVAESGVGVYSAMDVQIFNTTVFTITETDIAQTISVLKKVNVAQVTETGIAQAVGKVKYIPVVQAAEADESNSVSVMKRVSIAQVNEIDQANEIVLPGRLVQVLETDLAQAISRRKLVVLNTVVETGTAFSIGKRKEKAIIQTTEIDSANSITLEGGGILVSTAQEIDFAIGLERILKRMHVTFAEESNFSQPIEAYLRPKRKVKKWKNVMRGQSERSVQVLRDE